MTSGIIKASRVVVNVCVAIPVTGVPRFRNNRIRGREMRRNGTVILTICATQLVNAGCRITSIQKFLGHTRLNSTLTYARVHDETVAKDYYTAMQWVEKRMKFSFASQDDVQAFPVVLRRRLLLVAEQLKEPELDTESRLALTEQLLGLLEVESTVEVDSG